ncbi:MAG: hypothetical protein ACK4KW_06595 [Gemmobacter sp.]
MTGEPDPALLTRLALLGVFDPQTDAPGEPLASLARLSDEVETEGRWLWTLKPAVLLVALGALPPPGPARQRLLDGLGASASAPEGSALRRLLAQRPDAGLRRLIGGRLDDPADPLRLLHALQRLQAAGVELAGWVAETGLETVLRQAVLRASRRQGRRAGVAHPFRGRGRELKAMLRFVSEGDDRVFAPDGIVRQIAPAPPTEPPLPVLVIAGVGGIGKSALSEVFRSRVEAAKQALLVDFDLDEAVLRAGDPTALTREALRQLALAMPELDERLSALRGRLRLSSADRILPHVDTAVLGALSELRGILAGAGREGRPLLVLIDTFEEAMVIGSQRLRAIAAWVTLLRDQAGFGPIRLLLSGRATERFAQRPDDLLLDADHPLDRLGPVGLITLGDLHPSSGAAMLRDRLAAQGAGPSVLDLAGRLVAAFGANPLVIEILARYAAGRDATELVALIGDDAAAGAGFDAEMRQRFLYARILERIHDQDLRALANPGLVLRRLTPTAVAAILAEPCGLAPLPLPDGTAEELFERLAGQVWLVQPVPGDRDALMHRPDLRRLMLPLILSEGAAAAVLENAIGWHERRAPDDPSAGLEALYYRALAGQVPLPDLPEMLRALADHLGPDAADLPEVAQAQLNEATGRTLTRREIALLPEAAAARARRRRGRGQLSAGATRTLLEEASDHRPAPAPPEGDLPSPELVVAAFADCRFERVAGWAPVLVRALFTMALSGQPRLEGPETLPVWRGARAGPGRGQGHAAALRAAVEDGLSDRPRLVAALHKWPPHGPGAPTQQAVLLPLTRLAGLDPVETLGPDALDPPPDSTREITVLNLMELRQRLALLPAFPDLGLRIYATLFPTLAAPVLHALREGRHWLAIRPELDPRHPLNGIAHARQAVSLADLEEAEAALRGLFFSVVPRATPWPEMLLPGRLTEFLPAAQTVLEREPPERLARRVGVLAEDHPWWPRELAPEAVAAGHDELRMACLVYADRAGVLERLLPQSTATPDARQLRMLIRGFRNVWMPPSQADGAGAAM